LDALRQRLADEQDQKTREQEARAAKEREHLRAWMVQGLGQEDLLLAELGLLDGQGRRDALDLGLFLGLRRGGRRDFLDLRLAGRGERDSQQTDEGKNDELSHDSSWMYE
jgi:hypothetical protein